jgi:hypothetical protein
MGLLKMPGVLEDLVEKRRVESQQMKLIEVRDSRCACPVWLISYPILRTRVRPDHLSYVVSVCACPCCVRSRVYAASYKSCEVTALFLNLRPLLPECREIVQM